MDNEKIINFLTALVAGAATGFNKTGGAAKPLHLSPRNIPGIPAVAGY